MRERDRNEPENNQGINGLNEAVDVMASMNKRQIKSDVLGSYTGSDAEDGRPVQDADDL